MSKSLVEDYLRWLAPQIREDDGLSNPNREFWGLLTAMAEKEFIWHVPNDGNRKVDGLFLRNEFCDEQRIRRSGREVRVFLDKENPYPAASFLEVLIGISRRLAFMAGGKNAPGWAWVLLKNLNLHRMADPVSRSNARRVDDILDTCIHRTYSPDGTGGFFPLEHPFEDQTRVEIWYQMAGYVNEMDSRA